MFIREIMSQHPVCCPAEATVADAAWQMRHNEFGIVPVLARDGRVAGVITDRDIVCRVIAAAQDPQEVTLEQCMSQPAISVPDDADLGACLLAMKEHQVKRIIVVDGDGHCLGIVSQADLAGNIGRPAIGEIAETLAQPLWSASWGAPSR